MLMIKYREQINYVIAGILTTLVSIGSYNLFRVWIDHYLICVILAWIIAVTFAYITNRKFVFRSKESNIPKEMSKFFGMRISTLGIEMLFMFTLVSILLINDRLANILVQFIIVVLNYVFSKFIVFKNK